MANLDIIRTQTIRAQTEGFPKAISDVTNLGTATDTSSTRMLSQEKALAAVERRFIEGAKQAQEYEKVQRLLNIVTAQQPQLQDRANAVLAEAAVKLGQVTTAVSSMTAAMSQNATASKTMISGLSQAGQAALPKQLDVVAQGMTNATNSSRLLIEGMSAYGKRVDETNKKNDQFGNSTKAARFELLNLSRQVQDVGVGLTSGQSPFTVLVQQGSQIFDVFQSASLSGRSLGATILGMITPMRVLAVTFVAAAAAIIILYKNLVDTEKVLLTLSERFDSPIEKVRALQSVAAGGGIDLSSFTTAMEGFAHNVDRAKSGLGDLAELFRRNGKTAGDLTKDLLNVADLVRNAASGQQQYKILQEAGLPATSEWVRLLKQGSTALKDQIALAKSETDRNEQLAKQAEAFNEAWTKAWENFKRNAMNAAEASISFLSKLADKAGDFIQANQQRVLELRGFTPEQAISKLGRDALGAGAGTKLMSDQAAKFYDNMRAAGEKIDGVKTKTNENARDLAALDQRRAAILGNIISLEEAVRIKQAAITEAQAQGVQLSAAEVAQLNKIVELEEISRRSTARVGALGDAATAAEKYAAQIDALKVKLADTTINQTEFNRAASQLDPLVIKLKDVVTDLGDAMAKAFIQGQNGAEALNTALKAVASTAASGAIKSGVSGLTQFLKGGGTGGFDLASIATSGAIAIGASLLSNLFGDSKQKEQEAAAKQATDAMNQANDALKSVTASFMTFTAAADGAVTSVIKNGQQQFQQLKDAADAALSAANAIVNTPGNTPATMAAANQSRDLANASVISATARLKEFNDRTIETGRESLRGAESLSEVEQALKDMDDKAKDLQTAMELVGTSSEDAAAIIKNDLAVALTRLTQTVTKDLTRSINDLQGTGYINDIADALTKMNDAAKAGVDPDLISRFFTLSAQKIVDTAKLTGDAFQQLLETFPELNGVVTEFSQAAADAAAEVEKSVRSMNDIISQAAALNDRLFTANIHANRMQDTLEGQLAQFDRSAQAQRDAEQAAGGENIVLLEQTLAVERSNIVQDYNDKIAADQQKAEQDRLDAVEKANEDQRKAEQERLDIIKKANDDIIAYLQGLLTGSLSPLSAKAQLDSARAAYESQLALAKAGNLDALQNITKTADTFLTSSQSFFGSSKSYQADFQRIQAELGTLAGRTGGLTVGTPNSTSLSSAPDGSTSQFSTSFTSTGGALPSNDNTAIAAIYSMSSVLSGLLQRIADLEEEGNAIVAGQTESLTREQRFANRRRAAQG